MNILQIVLMSNIRVSGNSSKYKDGSVSFRIKAFTCYLGTFGSDDFCEAAA